MVSKNRIVWRHSVQGGESDKKPTGRVRNESVPMKAFDDKSSLVCACMPLIVNRSLTHGPISQLPHTFGFCGGKKKNTLVNFCAFFPPL